MNTNNKLNILHKLINNYCHLGNLQLTTILGNRLLFNLHDRVKRY